MSEGCTASSVVGGWAVPYVGVFFRRVGVEPWVGGGCTDCVFRGGWVTCYYFVFLVLT